MDDRRASGKAARKRAGRRGLGRWTDDDRGHDALAAILAQDKIRLPELVPLRHERMALSPWNYYRGAAAVMAADLASQPDSGLTVQLCGDAHVLNFGLWATPERNLSFDARDFDETLPGPFEWDVKRFAASLVVAARENRLPPEEADAAVAAGVEAYCSRIRRYRTMPELDIWYDGMHVDSLISYFEPADRGQVSVYIEKKRKRRTNRGAFAKLTAMVNGRPRITAAPPIRVTISDDEQDDLTDHLLAQYRLTLQEDRRSLFDRFTVVDVVQQVVGVGSVGMQVYLVLLEGRTGADPLFLQVKQAGPAVYEAYTRPSEHGNHGERVISGKRLIQSATDIFVGWGTLRGKDYYVRQFRDMKIIPSTELIAPRLVEFATACGETLARIHARAGDPAAIDSYIGKGPKFAAELGRFARSYADQNERDHAQLVKAIANGEVETPLRRPAGHSGRVYFRMKFRATANTRYISHRPVPSRKNPVARSPGLLSLGASGPRVSKNSATYTQARPMNTPPTGSSPTLKKTMMPRIEISRNATVMPIFARASARLSRIQPSANQCTPYAVNASAAMYSAGDAVNVPNRVSPRKM
jgi:uncharacterized protein (DUF2252 family)